MDTSTAAKAQEKQLLAEALDYTCSILMSAYDEIAQQEHNQDVILEDRLFQWKQTRDYRTKQLNESQSLMQQISAAEKQMATEIQQLQALVEARKAEAEGPFDYDAYAEPEDALMRAALPYHAKDLAIEDAQYHLEKALQNNTIDVKQFLKATRDLATEQYYQRAMLRKLNVRIPVQHEF